MFTCLSSYNAMWCRVFRPKLDKTETAEDRAPTLPDDERGPWFYKGSKITGYVSEGKGDGGNVVPPVPRNLQFPITDLKDAFIWNDLSADLTPQNQQFHIVDLTMRLPGMTGVSPGYI